MMVFCLQMTNILQIGSGVHTYMMLAQRYQNKNRFACYPALSMTIQEVFHIKCFQNYFIHEMLFNRGILEINFTDTCWWFFKIVHTGHIHPGEF